jgi:hypothetical protein
MPKQSYNKAGQRAEERMGSGAEEHNQPGIWVERLTLLCDKLHAEDDLPTESTTAAGRFQRTLYIARQGGKKPSPNVEQLKSAFDVDAVLLATFTGEIDGGSASGLHAEMMVVRYILATTNGITKKQLAKLGLEIGTTKGCCLDCAGWLNEQGIPHTRTTGKPSLMWRHPTTLSLYRHHNTKSDNEFINLKFYKAVGGESLL